MGGFSPEALDILQKSIGMLEVVFLEVMRLTQLFLGALW